jgi:hypothetical protein
VAFAQAEDALPPGLGLDRLSLRLRYGLSLHQGKQSDSSPGLTYSGLTPNDLSLWAVGYGLGVDWLGGQASVQREAFTFLRDSNQVTQGSLLRASLGLVAGRRLGPVWGELSAGYGFAQLPVFGATDTDSPTFQRGGRQAALLGGRLRFPLFLQVRGEVRAELPLSLSAREAEGRSATSSGFAAGAAILVPVKQWHRWAGSVVLDYQYVHDSLKGESGAKSGQTLQRMGVALELSWFSVRPSPAQPGPPVSPGVEPEHKVQVPEPEKPPTLGGLKVAVFDKRDNHPVANAQVVVGNKELKTDVAGLVRVGELAPGPTSVKVSAPDFQSVDEAALVVAGSESEMSVQLAPAKRVGYSTIAGKVRSTRQGTPLVATLDIPTAKVRTRTDAQGAFSVKLKPGTYRILISAKGHLTQTKTVTVRDGEQAIFNVDLFPRGR